MIRIIRISIINFLTTFIFFAMPAKAQTVKNYTAQWKKVEEYIKKKLPKSALTEVKKIYTLAKKENQDAQIIKSLVYITDLQDETREDNEVLAIKEMEKELVGSKEPITSIVNSLVAGMYFSYFENHRWQLYDRTKTTQFKKDDIATWGAEDFHKKISELYLKSIKEDKLLKQAKLEPFAAIIIHGNVRHLRPTLFDLLAHRSLDYFKNDETDIAKPAYAFEINQQEAFAPAAEFVKIKFSAKDSLSLKHKALLLYQQLISFHINDSKPDALLDLDISRLEYIKENTVLNNKDELFENALEAITKKYGDNPAAAQAWYLTANGYNEKGNEYKPYGDSTHRMSKLIAKEICERVLKQKDSSEGKINCYNLLNRITKKEMKFSLEKINIPGLPFRSLVEYRNIKEVFLRIIKADEKLKKELENRNEDKYWPTLIKAMSLKAWQQALPVTNDLQQHLAEIKIDALPPGEYILLAGSDKDFDMKKSIIGARMFYVSNISYIKNDKDFFVLHRESGQPLSKAAVQVWEQRYDNKQSKYVKQKGPAYTTDNNGYFKMTNPWENNYNYSYALEITHSNEKFFQDDWLHDYYYSNQSSIEKESTTVFIFTDRSIYRPGQTLYFKGIAVLSRANDTKQVNDKLETFIYLRDANNQTIDSLKVKTNEYGSFSGKFQLPQSGLNGNFTIYTKDNTGSASFRMEEYKRPKFFVDYEPLKGTYKVNDSIKITGFAKAYAGNNIDGANVKYRVVRQPRFIYPWLWRKWWMPPSEEMEITHGETKTDKDGKFTVEFEAIPDLKIEKKFEPVFDYTVFADITDINGETRSGEQSVSVSYKSLILKTDIPGILPADSLKSLSIRTENMNGEFQPARVNVKITKLKEEMRLIRNRFWDRPDQFIMSKEEYIKNFPFDEYDNETDNISWEKGETLLSETDSLNESKPFTINGPRLAAGFYQIEISTKDKNGEEVKDVQFIELFDEKSNQLNYPEYLWTSTKNEDPEPGEKMTVKLGTAADNLFIIQETNKQPAVSGRQSTASFSYFNLNNEKRSIDYEATEADRGGFGIGYLFVKHNRFHQFQQTVRVPWSNKDLKIEYATFRDKTLPGSEEKWKVKITGFKKEKVAAEMLASMYDASLDQFYPHYWQQPSIWPYQYNNRNWNGTQNFTKIESEQRGYIYYDEEGPEKYYDELFTSLYEIELKSANVMDYRQRTVKGERMSFASPSFMRDQLAANKVSYGELTILAEEVKKPSPDNIFNNKVLNNLSEQIQIRKNFNETAFFFPDLKTNENGDIEFSFTMPEALTKWKFQALAHTKDLAFGYSSKEIVTQKDLMVQPNAPRFLREGDKIEFSGKIVNLTDKEITGEVQLQLFDAATNEAVDGRFRNAMANQYFTVAAGQSEAVNFPMEIPFQFNKALVWRIVAKAGDKSDGEENALPVLTNRMLVTETMPLTMRGNGTKEFKFEKLINSGSSASLQHHALTVEYTSNPVWYTVQALPYLMEYPYECAEQTWNRYYANALASMIANSSPRIKEVFTKWLEASKAPPLEGFGEALLSNLQKNQELKALLLEETPWVLQAKNEEQQKKNIALLFDLIRMSNEMNRAFEKLKQMQSSNGGFVWFKGGPDNAYMTQYIVTGIGHLKKLNSITKEQESKLKQIVSAAIPYLDRQIKKEYDDLKKYKTDMKSYMPGNYEVQYLYMRSFFPEYKIAAASQTAYNYFRTQSQKTWTKQSKYMQGMIALALQRTADAKTPAAILKSLKETSIINEELGMYWKELTNGGYYWYQAPIETHSLLIEVFSEAGKDTKTVDDLKTWLLKNKQTNNWKTTKATAEACYALMLQGTNWLTNEPVVEIRSGDLLLTSSKGGGTEPAEAGTGYFKKTIDGDKVTPEMGNIAVTVNPPMPNQPINQLTTSWGSVYWQYFEDLDKITTASTPLKLEKKLFIEKNTDRGPVLTPVNDGDFMKVGDKIKVRIELRVDKDMEYVHMKDMRASAMEPVNVLSSYKWQGGLGYYETTKDASTNFFFDNLRKGTYVFEYPLFVTHKGNFSNGVTTIQCMYAPEFSSHSEGVRVNVE
jgi:hypothetical protein